MIVSQYKQSTGSVPTITLTTPSLTVTTSPFTMTITSDVSIPSVTTSKINVANGTLSNLVEVSKFIRTVVVTPIADGDVTLSILANKLYSHGGRGNTVSNTLVVQCDIKPICSTIPVISGSLVQGQTLSVTDGTWINSPTSYAYQWKRDGSNIIGETNNTYVLAAEDLYARTTCVVTATNTFGSGTGESSSVVLQYTGAGYYYRREITIDNTGNPAALTGEQVNIVLTVSNFNFTHARSDGADIRFRASDGITELIHYQESYTSTTASYWVRVTGVNAHSTWTIYIYYGNGNGTSASDENATLEFPTVAGDCTNLFSGINTYSGLFDTWPSTGTIKCHITTTGAIANKRIWSKWNSATDFVDCYLDAIGSRLTVNISVAGSTWFLQDVHAISAGVEHCVVFTWNSDSFILNLDGVVVHRRAGPSYHLPNSGSSAPFASGQQYKNTGHVAGLDWPGALVDGAIYNTQKKHPQVKALMNRRTFYAKDQESKWVTDTAYVYSDGSPSVCYEPSLLYEGGTYIMFYGKGVAAVASIYRTTSTDLVNWTAPVRVLGQGTNGESGFVARTIVFKEGTKHYICYQATGVTGGPLRLAESTDGGLTWKNNTTILAVNAMANNNGWHNTGFCKLDNGDWLMSVGGDNAVYFAPYRYPEAVFKSSNGLYGPYSAVGTNPKYDMQYASNYVFDCQFLHKIGSIIYGWGIQGTLTPLASEIYMVQSNDNGDTWTTPLPDSMDKLDRVEEVDQVGDPHICDDGTQLILSTDMLYNTVFTSYIGFSTYQGNFTQLLTDLSATAGTEELV